MTDFTLTATLDTPYDATLERVRALLADAGFGVLTEIDLQATLQAKLGVEIPPQVILGACRPQLAYAALQADPRMATLLPCNVVVSDQRELGTRVEILDPATITSFSNAGELPNVASEARERLTAMMTTLTSEGAA